MDHLIVEFREWTMWLMEAGILYYVAIEFYYDRDKDLAKQRKTRTTRKTTKNKDGGEQIEETIEETTGSETKL